MIKTGFYYSTYIGLVQANDGIIFKYFTRRYWVLFIHSFVINYFIFHRSRQLYVFNGSLSRVDLCLQRYRTTFLDNCNLNWV